jgi:hypothetical protein
MRLPGIEPGTSAWKADILPLNYKRLEQYLIAWYNFRRPPNSWVNWEKWWTSLNLNLVTSDSHDNSSSW